MNQSDESRRLVCTQGVRGNWRYGWAPILAGGHKKCVKAQQDPKWAARMMRGAPYSRREFWVLNTTGPGLISRTLAEDPTLATGITVLFPGDVCDFRNWNCFGELGIHLMNGSWRNQAGFLRRRMLTFWETWRMKSVLKQGKLLGKTRTHIPNNPTAL